MTQLLFQRFSQSIGCCARLNRWLSYCCGAHWSSYLFLKFPGLHISENFRISFLRSLNLGSTGCQPVLDGSLPSRILSRRSERQSSLTNPLVFPAGETESETLPGRFYVSAYPRG